MPNTGGAECPATSFNSGLHERERGERGRVFGRRRKTISFGERSGGGIDRPSEERVTLSPLSSLLFLSLSAASSGLNRRPLSSKSRPTWMLARTLHDQKSGVVVIPYYDLQVASLATPMVRCRVRKFRNSHLMSHCSRRVRRALLSSSLSLPTYRRSSRPRPSGPSSLARCIAPLQSVLPGSSFSERPR